MTMAQAASLVDVEAKGLPKKSAAPAVKQGSVDDLMFLASQQIR